MQENVAIFLGNRPSCDRCGAEDAKVHVNLPTYGERALGETCLLQLLEIGLKAHSLVVEGNSVDNYLKQEGIRWLNKGNLT